MNVVIWRKKVYLTCPRSFHLCFTASSEWDQKEVSTTTCFHISLPKIASYQRSNSTVDWSNLKKQSHRGWWQLAFEFFFLMEYTIFVILTIFKKKKKILRDSLVFQEKLTIRMLSYLVNSKMSRKICRCPNF